MQLAAFKHSFIWFLYIIPFSNLKTIKGIAVLKTCGILYMITTVKFYNNLFPPNATYFQLSCTLFRKS